MFKDIEPHLHVVHMHTGETINVSICLCGSINPSLYSMYLTLDFNCYIIS